MNAANTNDACDPRNIHLGLDGQLDAQQQAAWETHLEHCAHCRQALEEIAANADVWREAQLALSTHGDENTPPTSDWYGDERHEIETLSAADAILPWLGPTDDPRMLGRLAGYEIVGIVGRGGMGVVLKGFDSALNRYVAIKVLAPHLAASGSARRRFAREAQAAAAVVHENVIAIHGVSEITLDRATDGSQPAGLPFLVMPYVRGESLQKRLDRLGPLGLMETLRIGRQVAAGLAAAHAQGLIHRDIKPANILLESGVERLQITDFGLARTVDDASMTRTGIIAGTPQYMSPEQACGEAVDTRSDLFSLGSMLYTMCTGRPPFRAETSFGILRRITDSDPRPIREIRPDVPDWLVAIVEKLHAKSPNDRFTSAEDVSHLLEQCLAHVHQPDRQPLPASVLNLLEEKKRSKESAVEPNMDGRGRALRVGAAVAALLLTVLSVWAIAEKLIGNPGNDSSSAPSSSQHQGASQDPASLAEAWDDGIDAQLQQTANSISTLESDVTQLWDRPLPERTEKSANQP